MQIQISFFFFVLNAHFIEVINFFIESLLDDDEVTTVCLEVYTKLIFYFNINYKCMCIDAFRNIHSMENTYIYGIKKLEFDWKKYLYKKKKHVTFKKAWGKVDKHKTIQ